MLGTGDVLQDRYRVKGPLGRGGMGAVYEATDLRLSRTVALKETLAETGELRRAFEREARLLANLRHPALPKVLDHFAEGDGLFLVMEFIPGEDLGVMLERGGRAFAPAEVLRWAEQLLDALEYLHALDPPVLHRDIKPANLKLIAPTQIVLLDFGLAKGSAGQMTRAGSKSVLAYSPNYSPLEQIQGAGTDERSDLYSLAATLYHLLTGVKPADAITRAAAVVNGRPDPLVPARKVKGDVPAGVSAALTRALAPNIENRPRNVSEMRRELRDATPRAADTVPMGDAREFPVEDADEVTRVASSARGAAAVAPLGDHSPVRGRPVVVPLPEETRVAKGHGGGKWIAALGITLGVLALSAGLVYLLFNFLPPGEDARRRAQNNQPPARSSLSMTCSIRSSHGAAQ